ncbi:KPN_02809 family neutral zinc metallopeptidase [Ferrimonas pelagia]|uniref:Neutral zinc metallopeptidase n=1 Tax=Ferrimonas pelagia TaxID=1177826 RepID=A0ABP9F622_9GAMM
MRWRNRRASQNVEDRRTRSQRKPLAKGGIVGVLILLAAWYFGIDPNLINQVAGPLLDVPSGNTHSDLSPDSDPLAQFTSVVLADTETFWQRAFAEQQQEYQEPTLVLYRGATQTHCGTGQAAMGPFYCPADQTIYIDLSFYEDLRQQLGAPGDFAQAYVIAHEVGHHIQTLTGISQAMHQRQQRMSEAAANQESVKLELQADCLAGVWASYIDQQQWLESGDIEEAMQAAEAIGDDRLQMQSQGRIVPDSFTHGTSAQRLRWFQLGFTTHDPSACDTFNASEL